MACKEQTITWKNACQVRVVIYAAIFLLALCASISRADITGADVLVLVNQNSATSVYIADMYRSYHPEIQDWQVLSLSGLTDCSGLSSTAGDEILTRSDYQQYIADPVKEYLLDPAFPERFQQIKVLITTAGMPYRIEDTNSAYANVIYPAGSSPTIVSSNSDKIDAASVESDLTCLLYGDEFGYGNRLVNPYHGYRASSVSLFERSLPGIKAMNWNIAIQMIGSGPKMEGEYQFSPLAYGTVNRKFHAGDMYLVCRLDGPKAEGSSAIFAVRQMLERAKRASSATIGVNPMSSVAVLDDSPSSSYDQNRIYNLDGSVNYLTFDNTVNQPPDCKTVLVKDDYVNCFTSMTSESVDYSALNTASFASGNDIAVILDRRTAVRTSQTDIDALAALDGRQANQDLILLASFGANGDEGDGVSYLRPDGGDPLFKVANGAVFCSIESYNAVTMFSSVASSQAKIVDFIDIGGSGAIGHAFEPLAVSVVDSLYLFHNLLADDDGDGQADLTFIEAAYTAIPFLSWSEVVIGDPLMRISYGPGGKTWNKIIGDCNNDGLINIKDVRELKEALGADFNSSDPELQDRYNDLCDFNDDGRINIKDVRSLKMVIYN